MRAVPVRRLRAMMLVVGGPARRMPIGCDSNDRAMTRDRAGPRCARQQRMEEGAGD